MVATFSENEKKLLKGQSSKIADKHNCTSRYVGYIINGQRNIDNELSSKIFNDLNTIVHLLRPTSSESKNL